MLTKPDSCQGCELYTLGKGFMNPEGKGTLRVAVVAEALGYNEMMDGLPLRPQGQAGAVFERIVRRSGFTRDQFAIANMVWCQPPGNELVGAGYEVGAINHCREAHLNGFFKRYNPKVILTLGNTPTSRLTGLAGKKLGVTSIRGYAIDEAGETGRIVVPSYHPAFIARGQGKLTGAMVRDLKFAVAIAQSGLQRPIEDYIYIPDESAMNQFRETVKAHPEWFIYHDVETVDSLQTDDESEVEHTVPMLTQVQLMTDQGRALVMPWAEPYIAFYKEIMALPNPKGSWNGWEFDNYRYAENGVTLNGQDHDLMWAWHHWQPDLPRGLQYATSFFVPGMFPWKHIHGSDPGRYGWADVFTLRQNRQSLFRNLEINGLKTAYDNHIISLRSILVRMGERGIPIHRERWSKWGEQLISESDKLVADMQSIVPKEILRLHPKNGYVNTPKESERCPVCEGHGFNTLDEEDSDDTVDKIKCLYCKGKGTVSVDTTSGFVQREFYINDLKVYDPCVDCGGVGKQTVTVTLNKKRKGAEEKQEKTTCSYCNGGGFVGEEECSNCLGDGDEWVTTWELVKERVCSTCRGKGQVLKGKEEGTVVRWCRELPFNPGSADQWKDYIRTMGEKTGKKAYKVPRNINDDTKETTGKDALKKLAKETKDPIFKMGVEYKEWSKLRTSYYENWEPAEDGCVHARFSYKPATGQLAAYDPNVFTIPRRGDKAAGFRALIFAPQSPTRRVLVERDYTAAHALTLGFEAEDILYMNVARNDIHGFVTLHSKKKPEAQRAIDLALIGTPDALAEMKKIISFYREKEPEFERERNDKSKPAILGIGFKMGVGKLYKMNSDAYKSKAEAQKFKDILVDIFPKVLGKGGYQDRIMKDAYKGFLKSRHGYIRWFWEVYKWDPKTKSMVQGEDAEAAVAFNPANDAFGTMKESLLSMDRDGWLEKFSLINVVHDSVVFMPEWKDVDECLEITKQYMEKPNPYLVNSVAPDGLSIGSDVAIGVDLMKESMYKQKEYKTKVEEYLAKLAVTVTPERMIA